MSDQFRIQEAITFVQATPPETFRLMDSTINNLPIAYEHGKVLAIAAVVDLKVAEEVNIFVMNCDSGVSVKLGATTNPALSNVTHFSYKGNKTTIFVSNIGTEYISISYATCSL
jgi:hypothetical protein